MDSNFFMSLCKECIVEIYISQYNIERDLRRAIYNTCRIVNVLYSDSAVQATESQLKNKEILPDDKSVFGWYKAKIASTMKGFGAAKMGDSVGADFTFRYENSSTPERGEPVDFTGSESVIEFWGGDFSTEEYRFLEKELAEWKQSYSCQNKAEEFFMKQICLKALELEAARKGGGGSVDSILKSMQELLKNGSLTPAQQTAASSGKGVETWGMFIKTIEETTPAEYYKDKELFKDFDGIGEYIKKYITRPLKNFVTGSRDFNITEEDTTEYDEPNLEVINEPEAGKTE
ncbi:MAG: hypothetical protein IMZ52_06930 [Actinobacteria bacterium]|nr:hypothetical protein [Actinomycetota bacterium]